MTRRRLLTLIVLVLWVSFGPVAMMFSGCFLMAAMCDGLCGTSSHTTYAPTASVAPGPIAYLEIQLQDRLPDSALAADEPPPKPFALSA